MTVRQAWECLLRGRHAELTGSFATTGCQLSCICCFLASDSPFGAGLESDLVALYPDLCSSGSAYGPSLGTSLSEASGEQEAFAGVIVPLSITYDLLAVCFRFGGLARSRFSYLRLDQ